MIISTLHELRDTCAEHIQRGFIAPGWLLHHLDQEIQAEIQVAEKETDPGPMGISRADARG